MLARRLALFAGQAGGSTGMATTPVHDQHEADSDQRTQPAANQIDLQRVVRLIFQMQKLVRHGVRSSCLAA